MEINEAVMEKGSPFITLMNLCAPVPKQDFSKDQKYAFAQMLVYHLLKIRCGRTDDEDQRGALDTFDKAEDLADLLLPGWCNYNWSDRRIIWRDADERLRNFIAAPSEGRRSLPRLSAAKRLLFDKHMQALHTKCQVEKIESKIKKAEIDLVRKQQDLKDAKDELVKKRKELVQGEKKLQDAEQDIQPLSKPKQAVKKVSKRKWGELKNTPGYDDLKKEAFGEDGDDDEDLPRRKIKLEARVKEEMDYKPFHRW